MKKAAPMRLSLRIWKMPPSRPAMVKVKMPRTMKLTWPRVEKAASFLRSVCTRAMSAP
jgi:hypothetical protein